MNVDLSTVFAATTAIGTLAVPVVVAVMAARFNNQVKRWEANQWRNQELIKARLDYYRQLVPKLNDFYCYFDYVGAWQDPTPPEMLSLKRVVDKEFYCAKPLFSDGVGVAYNAFMRICFEMYGGMGTKAKFRTGFGYRKAALGDRWDPEWASMFTVPEGSEDSREQRAEMRAAYNRLIVCFADDIELTSSRDRYIDDAHEADRPA